MIVAIDGPAGAGKSTTARALARELGFAFLDTGALYRCAVVAADRMELPVERAAEAMVVDVGERVLLNGEDVTGLIRTPDVSHRTPEVAAMPEVREALLRKQREALAHGDWVAEGRDIGTVVAPHAEVKVFLTASASERAQRRAAELGGHAESVLSGILARDEADATREHSPLGRAPDAVEIDTTDRSLQDVVEELIRLVESVRRSRASSRKGRRHIDQASFALPFEVN